MKSAGWYLLLYFVLNCFGNIYWLITFIWDEPIFGSNYLEDLSLIIIYNLIAIVGLIGSFLLYKNINSIETK